MLARRLLAIVVLALLCISLPVAAEGGLVTFEPAKLPPPAEFLLAVPKAKTAPLLDGVIGDDEYAGAARIDRFVTYITGAPPEWETVAFITYDSDNFYFALRADDPDIGTAKFVKQKPNKPDTYGGDIVELFLDPLGTGMSRFQICSNVVGVRYDESPSAGGRWQGKWKSAGSKGEDYWAVEFLVPFAELGLKGAPKGEFWAANFIRTGKVSYTWTGGWQGSADYGKLFFGPTSKMREKLPPRLRLVLDRDIYSERDRYALGVAVADVPPSIPATLSLKLRQKGKVIWKGTSPVKERGTKLNISVGQLAKGDYSLSGELLGPRRRKLVSAERSFSKARVVRREAIEAPARGQVPISVWAHDGKDIGEWMIATGVPFPQGFLDSEKNVRLLEVNGKEAPAQFAVRSRWSPGGSIRWLGLDFAAGMAAEGTRYALEFGHAVKASAEPSTPLKVTEDERGIEVNTGPLRFVVRKEGFNLVDGVALDGRAILTQTDRGGPYLQDHEGTIFRTRLDPNPEVRAEEAGPLKAVIRAEAWYVREGSTGQNLAYELPTDRLCKCVARIIAHAGKPYLRVQHTWIVTCDTNKVRFADIGIEMNVPEGAEFQLGTEKGYYHGRTDGQPCDFRQHPIGKPREQREGKTKLDEVWLLQYADEGYQVESGRVPGESYRVDMKTYRRWSVGKKAPGWASVKGASGSLTVAVRDFWQTFPNELGIAPGALRVHIWPRHGIVPAKYNRHSPKEIHKLWHCHSGRLLDLKVPAATTDAVRYIGGGGNGEYISGGQYANAMGVSVTNELLLSFQDDEPDPASVSALAETFQIDPHALSSPEWNCSTDVLPLKLSPFNPKRYPWEEAKIASGFLDLAAAQRSTRDYGMFNHLDAHGDNSWYMSVKRYGDRGPAWMLNRVWNAGHHGVSRLGWMLYFRSGDRRYLEYARPNAQHVVDVDITHFHAKGLDLFKHAPGNTQLLQHRQGAMYHCKGYVHWGGDSSISGHLVNFDFALWGYYLTGNRRLLDGVRVWLDALIDMGGYPCIGRDGIQMTGELPEVLQWEWSPAVLDLLDRYAAMNFSTPLKDQGWYNYTQLFTRYWWFTRSRRAAEECRALYEAKGERVDEDWLATLYFATGDKGYLKQALPGLTEQRGKFPRPSFPIEPKVPDGGTWYTYAYPTFYRLSLMTALDHAGIEIPMPGSAKEKE